MRVFEKFSQVKNTFSNFPKIIIQTKHHTNLPKSAGKNIPTPPITFHWKSRKHTKPSNWKILSYVLIVQLNRQTKFKDLQIYLFMPSRATCANSSFSVCLFLTHIHQINGLKWHLFLALANPWQIVKLKCPAIYGQ